MVTGPGGRFSPGPEHREIVFLTGSGLSARTGLGTFRGPQGLWALEPETERAMHAEHLPDSLPQLWSVWGRMARIATDHGPTPGHRAIARMGAPVITQNIDGLHQAAGSKTVYELHGSTLRNYCTRCGRFYPVEFIEQAGAQGDGVPHCTECGGLVKPDVVLYEEGLDADVIEGAVNAIRQADLLIVGGTSLVVYPAAGLLRYFNGDGLIVINKQPTPADAQADLVLHMPIGQALGQGAV